MQNSSYLCCVMNEKYIRFDWAHMEAMMSLDSVIDSAKFDGRMEGRLEGRDESSHGNSSSVIVSQVVKNCYLLTKLLYKSSSELGHKLQAYSRHTLRIPAWSYIFAVCTRPGKPHGYAKFAGKPSNTFYMPT